MPVIQNWYQLEAEKEMWNKTGLLSPITSGSQLSELFIESESDWHLQVKEWEAPGAEWDQLYCWHSAILGELEGRLCQPSPTYNHWSTTYDMPQSLFEIVFLQTSITLRKFRTCLLPCSPSKGLPRFPVHVCARGEILAPIPKTFGNYEKIVFDNISICELFFLSIMEVCTTCLPIRGQPASRWVLLHTIII